MRGWLFLGEGIAQKTLGSSGLVGLRGLGLGVQGPLGF